MAGKKDRLGDKESCHVMASKELQALQEQIARNDEVDKSAVELINGFAARLEAIKTDPAAIQAFADELRTSSDQLAQAVVANTPAAENGGGEGTGGTEGGGEGGASDASARNLKRR
jgi:hypothetical protein